MDDETQSIYDCSEAQCADTIWAEESLLLFIFLSLSKRFIAAPVVIRVVV